MSIFTSKPTNKKSLFEILKIRNKLEAKSGIYKTIKASVLKKGDIVKFNLSYKGNHEIKFCEVLQDVALKPLLDKSFDEIEVFETNILTDLFSKGIIKYTANAELKTIDKEVNLMSFLM